jgi:hypothetical protein
LVESVDETITELLSRAVVEALYAHLQTVHSISRNELHHRLNTLFPALEKIFGVGGSQTISEAIAKKNLSQWGSSSQATRFVPYSNTLTKRK